MLLSRRTYVPFFFKPLKRNISIPPNPLLVLSTPEKHYQFFGLHRLLDLNMNIHFKTTGRKRLRIPSRTNLRQYIFYHSRFLRPGRKYVLPTIHGFSTLAANSKPQVIVRSRKMINLDTYRVRRYLLVPRFCRKHQVPADDIPANAPFHDFSGCCCCCC